MDKIYYKVTYLSPGSFFSESSYYDFKTFSIKAFCAKAKKIKERHGASPYGFTWEKLSIPVKTPVVDGYEVTVKPKVLKKTKGICWITGDLVFRHELIKDEEQIFASNLLSKGGVGIINRNSHRFSYFFEEEDIIVDWDGKLVRSGNDKDLIEYRKNCKY
jgi:hypothetical protein